MYLTHMRACSNASRASLMFNIGFPSTTTRITPTTPPSSDVRPSSLLRLPPIHSRHRRGDAAAVVTRRRPPDPSSTASSENADTGVGEALTSILMSLMNPLLFDAVTTTPVPTGDSNPGWVLTTGIDLFSDAASSSSYEWDSWISEMIGDVPVGIENIDSVSKLIGTSSPQDISRLDRLRVDRSVCPICHDILVWGDSEEDASSFRSLDIRSTQCDHIFCDPCLRRWLTTSKKCPLCMVELQPS